MNLRLLWDPGPVQLLPFVGGPAHGENRGVEPGRAVVMVPEVIDDPPGFLSYDVSGRVVQHQYRLEVFRVPWAGGRAEVRLMRHAPR